MMLAAFRSHRDGPVGKTLLRCRGVGFTESANPPFQLFVSDPNFSAPITNITTPVGREAVLTCIVHDLISYKVIITFVPFREVFSIQFELPNAK